MGPECRSRGEGRAEFALRDVPGVWPQSPDSFCGPARLAPSERYGALFGGIVGETPDIGTIRSHHERIVRALAAARGTGHLVLNPPRALEHASHRPSGDQAACASFPGLSVSRASPVPSALMV